MQRQGHNVFEQNFFFSSRRRHTRYIGDWSSDVCSSDLVTSSEFAGKSSLDKQRLVYGAITHLMTGDAPPVHAVDSLTKIGRASCRERVLKSAGAVASQKRTERLQMHESTRYEPWNHARH